MITGLKIYNLKGKPLEMFELTKNTVVVFGSSEAKNGFVEKFHEINDDETENDKANIIYSTIVNEENAENEDHKAILNRCLVSIPTTIYEVDNEQKFTFTTDASFALQCTDRYDLWFCEYNSKDEMVLYSFTAFKKHQNTWNNGVGFLYKEIVEGRYGCCYGCGHYL